MGIIIVVSGFLSMVMIRSMLVVFIVVIMVMWSRFFLWRILLKCFIIKFLVIMVKLLILNKMLKICGEIW